MYFQEKITYISQSLMLILPHHNNQLRFRYTYSLRDTHKILYKQIKIGPCKYYFMATITSSCICDTIYYILSYNNHVLQLIITTSKLIDKQQIELQPALLFFFEMNISFWAGLMLNIILLNEVNITLLNRLTYTQNLL